MKTLKLALVTTTAASAVAAATGITYAMVGNSSPVPSAAKNLSVAKSAPHVLPAPKAPSVPALPTCLPKLPDGAAVPLQKVPNVPQAGKLPTGKLPTGKLPTGKLPKLPDGTLPTGKLPTGKLPTGKLPVGKLPAGKLPKLPTCKGEAAPLPKPGLPSLPKPGAPQGVDCSAMPPAIDLHDGKAKDIALPTGAHLAFSHTHTVHLDGRTFCANVEKFVGVAGGFLTIERINTPPQVTLTQLADALDLTKGNVASVNGTDMWRSPAGDGMLWYSNKGYALYLNSSPALKPLLPGLSSQLRAQ